MIAASERPAGRPPSRTRRAANARRSCPQGRPRRRRPRRSPPAPDPITPVQCYRGDRSGGKRAPHSPPPPRASGAVPRPDRSLLLLQTGRRRSRRRLPGRSWGKPNISVTSRHSGLKSRAVRRNPRRGKGRGIAQKDSFEQNEERRAPSTARSRGQIRPPKVTVMSKKRILALSGN
jgi:hypothetical protein